MAEIPDDAGEAERLALEIWCHTVAPTAVEEMHQFLLSEWAACSEAWTAAHRATAYDAERSAAAEWARVAGRLSVVLARLSALRPVLAAEQRGDAKALIVALPPEGWGE